MIFSYYRSGLRFPVIFKPQQRPRPSQCKRSSDTFLKHFLNIAGTKEIIVRITMERRVPMSNRAFFAAEVVAG
jgi:hypothetical protein